MTKNNKKNIFLFIILIFLFFFSLTVGKLEITIKEILTIVVNLFSPNKLPEAMLPKFLVFTQIRIPRCIAAVLVGMGLSISGSVYQALFKNPLVSPNILGVTSGCTFGAAIGLILPFGLPHFYSVRLLAFIFGLVAVFSALFIARIIDGKKIIILILSGMVVMSFFTAMLMMVKYFSDPYNELPSIVFWTMGSLHKIGWQDVFIIMPITLFGIFLFYNFRFKLNVLSLGDEQSKNFGLNPYFIRFLFILISSLIVAIIVASCGQIAWVGLLIPHIARTITGPDHKDMIPVAILLGGIFMLFTDNITRSFATFEIPIGIITSLLGAPFFAFLLYKNRKSGWI